jgi:OHCU decarboxylase
VRQGIERLNSLTHEEAEAELLKCCGSTAWACGMAVRRPFDDVSELLRSADEVWAGLEEADWLEAFGRHPKIGERESAAAQTQDERAWSEREQSGMNAADDEARAELAELNRVYERRFGYIFIVCATGKSPLEMLETLKARLGNDPATEIGCAAVEQRQITRLRLEKLLEA